MALLSPSTLRSLTRTPFLVVLFALLVAHAPRSSMAVDVFSSAPSPSSENAACDSAAFKVWKPKKRTVCPLKKQTLTSDPQCPAKCISKQVEYAGYAFGLDEWELVPSSDSMNTTKLTDKGVELYGSSTNQEGSMTVDLSSELDPAHPHESTVYVELDICSIHGVACPHGSCNDDKDASASLEYNVGNGWTDGLLSLPKSAWATKQCLRAPQDPQPQGHFQLPAAAATLQVRIQGVNVRVERTSIKWCFSTIGTNTKSPAPSLSPAATSNSPSYQQQSELPSKTPTQQQPSANPSTTLSLNPSQSPSAIPSRQASPVPSAVPTTFATTKAPAIPQTTSQPTVTSAPSMAPIPPSTCVDTCVPQDVQDFSDSTGEWILSGGATHLVGSLAHVLSNKLDHVVDSVVGLLDSANDAASSLDANVQADLGWVGLAANATLERDLTANVLLGAAAKHKEVAVDVEFCFQKPQMGKVLSIEANIGGSAGHDEWKKLASFEVGVNLPVTSRVKCVHEKVLFTLPPLLVGLKLRLVNQDPLSVQGATELLIGNVETNFCLSSVPGCKIKDVEDFAMGLGLWTSQGPALLGVDLPAGLDVDILHNTGSSVQLDASASLMRDFGSELLDVDLSVGTDVQLSLDLCHDVLTSAHGVLELDVDTGHGWYPVASFDAGANLAVGVAGCARGLTESFALPAGTTTLKVRLSALDHVWIAGVKASFCTAPKPELAECDEKAMDVCVAVDVSGSVCSPSGLFDLCLDGSCSEQGLDLSVACNNFHLEKSFLAGLIKKLSLYGGANSKRFSVVAYANETVSLGEEGSHLVDASAALELLHGMEYSGGYSNTGGAIRACLDTFAGGESDRARSIVLVSSGLPSIGAVDVGASLDVAHSDYLKAQADAAFDMGVELFPVSVGIDFANANLLAEVATEPSHLVKVNAFLDLIGGIGVLLDKFSCTSLPKFSLPSVPMVQPEICLDTCVLTELEDFSSPASLMWTLGGGALQLLGSLDSSLGALLDTTASVLGLSGSDDSLLDATVTAQIGWVELGAGATLFKDFALEDTLNFELDTKHTQVKLLVDFCYKKNDVGDVMRVEFSTDSAMESWTPLIQYRAGANLALSADILCVEEQLVVALPPFGTSLKLRLTGESLASDTSQLLIGSLETSFCLDSIPGCKIQEVESFVNGVGSWVLGGLSVLDKDLSLSAIVDASTSLVDAKAGVQVDGLLERDWTNELGRLAVDADIQFTYDICYKDVEVGSALHLEWNVGNGWDELASYTAGSHLAVGESHCLSGLTRSLVIPKGSPLVQIRFRSDLMNASGLEKVWITDIHTDLCTSDPPLMTSCPEKPIDLCVAVDVSGAICSPTSIATTTTGDLELCLDSDCQQAGFDAAVSCNHYQMEKDFIANMLTKLSLQQGGTATRVSVVSYADTAVLVNGEAMVNASTAVDLVAHMAYSGGWSNTGGAINACAQALSSASPSSPDDDNDDVAEQVIVLVSAGLPTIGAEDVEASVDIRHREYVHAQAEAAATAGISVLPVSIGVDATHVQFMAELASSTTAATETATTTSLSNAIHANMFGSLTSVVDSVLNRLRTTC